MEPIRYSNGSYWRPSNGFYAEAPEQSLAFYLNGEIDYGSSITTQVLGPNNTIVMEGMVVINKASQMATNLSTAAFSGSSPRTGGGMVYLSEIGSHGILVAMGGTYQVASGLDDLELVDFMSLAEVNVYDIGAYYGNNNVPNHGWFTRNATSDVPEPRTEFCVVAINAYAKSNYNIYLYGGRGPNNVFYDNVYVLSIPSFIWTKVFGPGLSPRYDHTCHVIGRQMITVGGGSPAFASDPQSYCDWEEKGVAVLHMSNTIWGSVYSINAVNYSVPDMVSAKVGDHV